jgi:hypothetical protein
MTDYYSSYQNPPLGVPAFEELDTYVQAHLLSSASPPMGETVRILLASSKTLARYSVVALDGSKHLVLAVQGTHTPIGVLAHAAESAGSNTTIFGEVHLTGDYNTDADSPLVWDSSWDTQAKKNVATVGNPNLMFRSRNGSASSQP